MNITRDPAGPQDTKPTLSDADKTALEKSRTLFRLFMVSVLGAFFVYQLDVSYVWLTAILTIASLVLGIVLLVRASRYPRSKFMLFGTISGLVVTGIMALLVLVTAVFYQDISSYQECEGRALTDQAQQTCRVQLEKSLPNGMP